MAAIFSQILNMSMTGSVVILFVMVVRFLLKRSPKIFSYALWSVVLFRLLCPVAFTAPVSVLDVVEPKLKETSNNISMVSYIPENVDTQADFIAVQPESVPVNQEEISEPEERLYMTPMHAAALVWAAGAAGMLLYSVGQYLHLRRKLIGAVLLNRNIYVADHIDTAFVVGLGNPRIYLPSCVPVKERFYILAHEQYHIRRFDHVIKLLAYFALCIHWFNPLVWIAFILAGRDMEMSCDEAVLKKLGIQIRADYSATLLRLATHRKILSGMPLAFGEGDTKGRILNMAKWKKPKLWVSVCGVILCLAVLAACAVNPVQEAETEADQASAAAFSDESINILFTLLSGEEESSVIVSVHPNLHTITLGTILQDTYVSLPDYQGHRTEKNKFSACYTLGKAWGGTEGAEEMVNRCIQENFGITVDHNLELVDADFTGFMDILNDVAGKLDTPLDSEQQEVSDRFLSLIAGSEDPKEIRRMKEKLAEAKWESCTLPYEGTYTAEEVEIGGIKTWVLKMEEPQENQDSKERIPAANGFPIVTDTELVQYGALKMLLPSGFATVEKDGSVVLTKDSVAVGGITCWNHPGFEPDDVIEWLRALGIPQLQEDYGAPIGYMAGNSAYGDLEIEIFWDGDPNALNEEHIFFIDGSLVYDAWYDQNLISDGIAEGFLKTISINEEPVMETVPDEQEALAKCRFVWDEIQNGTYKIISRQVNAGNEGPKGYERIYLRNNGDWLSVTNVLTEGENIADGMEYSVTKSSLCANGKRFGYTGTEWVEIENDENSRMPWLADFVWDDTVVTYMDTLKDDNGECVMLRVDEKYVDSDEFDPHYFLFFNFTPDGSFVNVELQVNLFKENEFTITESIVSLDPEAINAEIQKEYQKAIG